MVDKVEKISKQQVVTRIAPSPTGDPHVGTAYVGLFNWVFAQQHGGKFILRIEDTDQARYNAESEKRILEMMDWLGITPDEDPERGGANGPYRQSERLELYHKYANELLAQGVFYRAFETEEELQKIREEAGGYDGRGRELSAEESQRRAEAGEPFVLRMRTPDEGETTFHDMLRGDVTIPNSELRDQVMLKSDGFPTYHLAVVVDDHLMGVTHVIRGEDWVVSTPLRIHLYKALGWDVPHYAHLPLLRNTDKSRLSKRKSDTSVDSYRQQGILPQALLNFLGTMGWSMPDGREFFSKEDLLEHFSLDRISLGGPVFDFKKLKHFNAHYIREVVPFEDLAEQVKPFLQARGLALPHDDYLMDVLDVMAERVETLDQFASEGAYWFREDYEFTQDARKKIQAGQSHLQALEREFALIDPFDYDAIDDAIRSYTKSKSVKMGEVMMPLRAALTGTTKAPSVTDIIEVMGKERVLRRFGYALEYITQDLPDDKPLTPEEAAKLEAEEKAKAEAAEQARIASLRAAAQKAKEAKVEVKA